MGVTEVTAIQNRNVIDEREAAERDLDRLLLEVSDVEPHLIESKLDELAECRSPYTLSVRRECVAIPIAASIDANAQQVSNTNRSSIPTGKAPCGQSMSPPSLDSIAITSPGKKMEVEEARYKFQWPDESFVSRLSLLLDSQLTSALEEIINRRGSDGQLVAYLNIKNECCAINVIMNQRGLLPPAFRANRPLPKPTKGLKPTDDAETRMLVDRQIIDIHWLHCRGKRHKADSNEFANLLQGDQLNRDLAEQFALKSWTAEIKVDKVLKLIESDQWQMSVLRSKRIKDIWRNARNTMENKIDLRLREQAVKEPTLIPYIEDLKYLWLADKIARHLGQRIIGEVYSWLTGSQLVPSTLSAKLKRMRRRTGSKLSHA